MKHCIFYLLLFGFNVSGYCQTNDSKQQQADTSKQLHVAVLLFDDVEILDFAGPLEVFSVAELNDAKLFNVYTVALNTELITSQKVLKVKPQYNLDNCPVPDIIVLPGGDTRLIRENKKLINWIKEKAATANILLSVCSGASFLCEAGLLDNKTATTHKYAIDILSGKYPKTTFLRDKRFVDNGKIITTAGVSAGIDGSLYVVERLFGEKVALDVADYMEYDYRKSF